MITAERAREAFDYDPVTGVFYWRIQPRQGVNVGDVAGTPDSYGYHILRIDRGQFKAHRVAWLYVYGHWPNEQIDHVNGVRSDNRIVNLRLASHSQNRANTKMHADNKCGYKGVRYQRHTKKNPWRAQISYGGTTHHIGNFPTPEEAHAAYCAAAQRVFGDFARVA